MKRLNFKMPLMGLIAMIFVAFNADSARAQATFSLQNPVMQATGGSTPAEGSKAKKPKKEKKAKAKKGGGVTFHEGSGETRAERDKRLMRECKGRPNAGLCEGYARP
jgi:50S ribosomal subunit-associated GTPase HflX